MRKEDQNGRLGSYGMNERTSRNSLGRDREATSAHPVLPPRGDYRTLLSFHKGEVVYDITFRFAHKHLRRGDRTIDQMIQSAPVPGTISNSDWCECVPVQRRILKEKKLRNTRKARNGNKHAV